MLHELDFADVHGLVDAYALVAGVGEIQSCEIDLDQLRLSFTTRFPLAEAVRRELDRAAGLRGARCWPPRAPVLAVP